ncbi:MAG: CPBP family intramembrane metalloprotease [Deltaproteobacteria bacterium]|nr:CPBP family intramembrane metalloprotease [Deltaproteobacteria bacterium]
MESHPSSANYPRRLIYFLFAVLALTCIISPWLALGADWVSTGWPDLLAERVPFPRIFNRAFMISGIVLFIFCRRQFDSAQLKRLCIAGWSRGCRDLGTGLALALGSMVLLAALMTFSAVYTPFFRVSLGQGLGTVARAVSAGIFAGGLEEVFFRGLLFKGIHDAGHPLRAFLGVNLFFSALHFVRPGQSYFLDSLDPFAGFRHLLTTFAPFGEPLAILPGLLGLWLIGIVLSYALIRSSKIYLSIGLHAGWIVGLKSLRVFGDFRRADLGWLYGASDPKIVSGAATFVGVFVVGILVHWITRNRGNGISDS